MPIHARTIQISLDHLTAEVATFPFVSQAAFKHVIHSLCFRMHAPTDRLWRDAEMQLSTRFPSLSLDELVALRNDTWFGRAIDESVLGQDNWKVPLHKLIRYVADAYLVNRGSVAEPRCGVDANISGAEESTARRTVRWLLFSIPGDLLLAGLSRNATGPIRLDLLSSAVDSVLRETGFPETHLHMGAGFDFPTVWAAATNAAGRAEGDCGLSYKAFCSPGAEHDEGKNLSHWHLRGCIVRYILGAFLEHRRPGERLRSFYDREDYEVLLTEEPVNWDLIQEAIEDLMRGRIHAFANGMPPEDSYAEFVSAYDSLTRVSTVSRPERLDEVQRLDPLSNWFQALGHQGPSVQLQFLWRGLEYLSDHGDDLDFACLFWQVERIRCQVYRHCVQRPLTPGLMNFIRFYDRKSSLTQLLENVELESCGVLGGIGHGLRSLEVRTSPKRHREQIEGTIEAIQGQLTRLRSDADNGASTKSPNHHHGKLEQNGWSELECGLVFHFLKFRGGHADKGTPLALDLGNNADPSDLNQPIGAGANNGFRWGEFVRKSEEQADAIASAIENQPRLLATLRGIDVCRDEHGVPCWVIARLFRRVSDRVVDIVQAYRHRVGKELPQLHTTAHVGEDFVHLTTGLRYMDEAFVHLGLRSGDRVGHGLALGIRPDLWAKETTRMTMPREDRWLDLIWERSWHSFPDSNFSANRIRYVEDEIVRLSRVLFPQEDAHFDWTPDAAKELVDRLFDVDQLSTLGFPLDHLVDIVPSGIQRQLERYLTDPSVYRRCRQVEWVPVEQDLAAVVELQRLVRQRYAGRGITIEVNPISNLLIGNLTDLQTHPLWRLAPGAGNDDGETLRICVGSDDPLPFSTTLREEYQFLYDSFILAGKSPAEARSWLYNIAKLGMESRFTLPSNLPELAGIPLGI